MNNNKWFNLHYLTFIIHSNSLSVILCRWTETWTLHSDCDVCEILDHFNASVFLISPNVILEDTHVWVDALFFKQCELRPLVCSFDWTNKVSVISGRVQTCISHYRRNHCLIRPTLIHLNTLATVPTQIRLSTKIMFGVITTCPTFWCPHLWYHRY